MRKFSPLWSWIRGNKTQAGAKGPQSLDAAARRPRRQRAVREVGSGFGLEPLEGRMMLSAVVGTGAGLQGQYYSDMNLATLKTTRTDPTVNFAWANGVAPASGMNATGFSARWSGQIQAQYSETYNFTTTSDDGVRLWVNGQQIINNWTDHAPTSNSGSITLAAGQKYDIKMEYYQDTGGATAKLAWSSPSTAQQVVPSTQLYGTTGTTGSGPVVGTGNGLQGQYYSDMNLTTLATTRTDPSVNFAWANGVSPASGMNATGFSARWSGQVQAQYSGAYTFTTTSDDGVRLWVNGQQIINNWTDHGPTANSGTITLVAGQKYDIKMEYYQNTGSGTAKLAWSGPSTALQVIPQSQLYSTSTGGGTGGGGTGGGTTGTYTHIVNVSTSSQLSSAIRSATAGTEILVAPGTYSGSLYSSSLHGTSTAPIMITAADPNNRPVIQGGAEGLHLGSPTYVTLQNLIFAGSSDNGINIDDSGNFSSTPADHVTLNNITVHDLGSGNEDGIKLSGVKNLTITGANVYNWGTGGSGIDMVGCFNGTITNSRFSFTDNSGGNGVEAKGGSSNIVIRGNTFSHASPRAIQFGGNTDQQYFRPSNQGYEARNITAEGNLIIGSQAPVVFASTDGCTFRYNTVYNPTTYLMRILQEDTKSGMVSTRNGVLTDNIFYFSNSQMSWGGINVGGGTSASTFSFARNWWYASDNPGASQRSLPSTESGGRYGVNPQFVNPSGGDFHLQSGSSASIAGAYGNYTPTSV